MSSLQIREEDMGSSVVLAESILAQAFRVPGCTRSGLVRFQGAWFQWYADRAWVPRTEQWVRKTVVDILSNVQVPLVDEDGRECSRRLVGLNRDKVEDVMYFLETKAETHSSAAPFWLEPHEDDPDPRDVIAFSNCLVDVRASAETGEMVVMPNPGRLFTYGSLKVPYDPDAQCPTWEKCLAQWGCGDPAWGELRERVYGYALTGRRDEGKFLFEYGKARGGKGTGIRVLESLMMDEAVVGTDATRLTDTFALQNKRFAQVIVVNEVHSLSHGQKGHLGSLVKQITGGDRVEVNVKFGDITSHRFNSLIILQANELVALPNAGRALTARMLPLYFQASWVGREDERLEERLLEERAGIARRLAEAAVRVYAGRTREEKWPLPQSSQEMMARYETLTSPWDVFLSRYFEEDSEGFVANSMLAQFRRAFEEEQDDPYMFTTTKGGRVADERFAKALREHSSWVLTAARRGAQKTRGLGGLRLKEVE